MEPKLMARKRFAKSLQEKKLFLQGTLIGLHTNLALDEEPCIIHDFITLS